MWWSPMLTDHPLTCRPGEAICRRSSRSPEMFFGLVNTSFSKNFMTTDVMATGL